MEARYTIESYTNWRRDMERQYGKMIYGGSNGINTTSSAGLRRGAVDRVAHSGPVRANGRLRYDGPICLDRPDMGESWTVTDLSSPYYKFTNCRESLMDMGFTAAELDAAKGVQHV